MAKAVQKIIKLYNLGETGRLVKGIEIGLGIQVIGMGLGGRTGMRAGPVGVSMTVSGLGGGIIRVVVEGARIIAGIGGAEIGMIINHETVEKLLNKVAATLKAHQVQI